MREVDSPFDHLLGAAKPVFFHADAAPPEQLMASFVEYNHRESWVHPESPPAVTRFSVPFFNKRRNMAITCCCIGNQ